MAGFTKRAGVWAIVAVFAVAVATTMAAMGGEAKYDLDAMHTSVVFKIKHMGKSYVYGLFTDASGKFTVDEADAARSSFDITIKTASVNTGNAKRDDHLRSPDFFNAKEFPNITFKSTKVSGGKDGLSVAGNLTLHGVTKPVTLELKKVGGDDKGIGYEGGLSVKRSDFGMDKSVGPDSDTVAIILSFEGVPAK